MYDKNNIFHKILRSEIPAKIIYEDDTVLSFHDINPVSKIHALVITKGLYSDFPDFIARASAEEVKHFFAAVAKVAEILGVSESGYRILSNAGPDSGQEVPHFHLHILGGERLRR
ncbi:MAG: histidine triad nucleotide-binding protein [Holosporaceae bacterium]|jgi:diadenosine tetraphosphate (Ap4A) HIT family hydrolase|nr:histidine triad nucleotide-binding protein [Holosporaceae bacterium]